MDDDRPGLWPMELDSWWEATYSKGFDNWTPGPFVKLLGRQFIYQIEYVAYYQRVEKVKSMVLRFK